jgi:hypothetical protein
MDGDTIEATLDLGFGVHYFSKFRMTWYAPELDSKIPEEKEMAHKIKQYLEDVIYSRFATSPVYVITKKDRKEKYGRYLADVIFSSGIKLSEMVKIEFIDWIK